MERIRENTGNAGYDEPFSQEDFKAYLSHEELIANAKGLRNNLEGLTADGQNSDINYPKREDDYETQNLIFSFFANKNPDESAFLDELIKNGDYIATLTEKDNSGEYLVSDEKMAKFTDWYASSIIDLENELVANLPEIKKRYITAMRTAVIKNYLPSICATSAANNMHLEDTGFQTTEYSLFDHTLRRKKTGKDGNKSFFTPAGFFASPINHRSDFVVGIAIDTLIKNSHRSKEASASAFEVLNHEMTHRIGDHRAFSFADTSDDIANSANIIVKEAITEDIGGIISNIEIYPVRYDIKPFSENGKTYPVERQTLGFLQSGGTQVINPNYFYEAYMNAGKGWQNLKRELFEAFPECNNSDKNLANFIVEKYNEFRATDNTENSQ